MFNLGGGEVLVILVIALVVLGPDRLPEAARSLGRALREVRRLSEGFQREMREAFEEPRDAVPAPAPLAPEPPLRAGTGDRDGSDGLTGAPDRSASDRAASDRATPDRAEGGTGPSPTPGRAGGRDGDPAGPGPGDGRGDPPPGTNPPAGHGPGSVTGTR